MISQSIRDLDASLEELRKEQSATKTRIFERTCLQVDKMPAEEEIKIDDK